MNHMSDFLDLNEFKEFCSGEYVYVFDTNVYLNLLRYSNNTANDMLEIYIELKKDIWVPRQVYKEFKKNFPIVNGTRENNIKYAITQSKNAINLCYESIKKQLSIFGIYKFSNSEEILKNIHLKTEELKECINDYNDINVKDTGNKGFLDAKEVDKFFDNIVSEQRDLLQSELLSIYKEGDIRYKYKIPPGYMDDPKNNPKSKKVGTSIFGDLILWNEIISYSKKQNKPIIFVTADTKEDWFVLKGKKPISPCIELLDEFSEKTNGNSICILTSEKFIEYISNVLVKNSTTILIEMQKDLFINTVFQNNKDLIKEKLIDWANDVENFYMLPLSVYSKKVIDIENIISDVQSVAVDVGNEVAYTVNVNITADIIGDDDSRVSLSLTVDILLKRARETTENRTLSEGISDLTIISVDNHYESCYKQDESILNYKKKRYEIIKKVDNSDYDEYFIISKSKTIKFKNKKVIYWFSEHAHGYTDNLNEAGKFTKEEVKKYVCPYSTYELNTKCIAIPRESIINLFNHETDTVISFEEMCIKIESVSDVIIGEMNWELSSNLIS